jgi:hypothetical protein
MCICKDAAGTLGGAVTVTAITAALKINVCVFSASVKISKEVTVSTDRVPVCYSNAGFGVLGGCWNVACLPATTMVPT